PFSIFFKSPATSEIYTLSLHDALPICERWALRSCVVRAAGPSAVPRLRPGGGAGGVGASSASSELSMVRYASSSCRCWSRYDSRDRKSTRLNSSHDQISYAVFCLKKKK